MQRENIFFESSPLFILACLALAIGGAYLLYRGKRHQWSRNMNVFLFVLRAVLLFFIAVLLLGPVVRQIINIEEKPHFIVLQDNSVSVREGTDSASLVELEQSLRTLNEELEERGFETHFVTLDQDNAEAQVNFNAGSSDITGTLRRIANQFEGRNIEGVLLVSDGIYNSGLSPLYNSYRFPVYTLGLGDTTERSDIAIRNLAYNRISYQGNRFPIKAEITVKGFPNQNLRVTLLHQGKVLAENTVNTGAERFLVSDFIVDADEAGLQRYEVQVTEVEGEFNSKNNRATAFIEVIEGKKKILLISPFPHPDIKALRTVINKNANYELVDYIPGVSDWDEEYANTDLVIFYQVPDLNRKTTEIFQRFVKSNTSLFLILGPQSDLRELSRSGMPVVFEGLTNQFDDVMPIINPGFSQFSISPENPQMFANYPPVKVHFGRVRLNNSATPILFQKIRAIATERPLLAVDVRDSRKVGLLFGEGIYRWRLHEYSRTEKTNAFDELFGKLIQYLTTNEDRKKFNSYPIRGEFSDAEPVIVESQVYNDVYEPVYGNTVEITIRGEQGKLYDFQYVLSPGNSRYQTDMLPEGVYRYRATTEINGELVEDRDEFIVVAQQIELQNLTADFNLLRELANQTGGKFYRTEELEQLAGDMLVKKATGTIHSEERMDAVINLKWLFWILLVLVAAEWFIRRFSGAY